MRKTFYFIAGGALAIDVTLSPWLTACTFLLATFLALGKRKHELVSAGDSGAAQRKVLASYNLKGVTHAMWGLAAATSVSYAAYVVFGETLGGFSPRDFAWTLPSVILGLWRFNTLTRRTAGGRSPTDLMLKDPLFMGNIVVWGIIVVVAIYG